MPDIDSIASAGDSNFKMSVSKWIDDFRVARVGASAGSVNEDGIGRSWEIHFVPESGVRFHGLYIQVLAK